MFYPFVMKHRSSIKNLLLADDDMDEILFFKLAIKQLDLDIQFTSVVDSEKLMLQLEQLESPASHVIFLDLNMPRMNGFRCLEEIKSNKTFSKIPVVVYSTSYDSENAEKLYKKGAHYYICKPASFEELKKVINRTITVLQSDKNQPPQGKFYINNYMAEVE